MKKTLLLLLMVVLAISCVLTSCNKNEEKTVELGFILDDTTAAVTCHFKDNKWTVCPECTDFE